MSPDLPKSLLQPSALSYILEQASSVDFKGRDVGLTKDGRLVVVSSTDVTRKKRMASLIEELEKRNQTKSNLGLRERRGVKAISSEKVVECLKPATRSHHAITLKDAWKTIGMSFQDMKKFHGDKIPITECISEKDKDGSNEKLMIDGNRYDGNIRPPKETAIKVIDSNGKEKYMHANRLILPPMNDGIKPAVHIRMQHPMPAESDQIKGARKTSEHSKSATFKMLYQENVGKFSNLTNLSTNDKGDRSIMKKGGGPAFDYWPAESESAQYDNIKVTTEKVVRRNGYSVITMKLEDMNLEGAERVKNTRITTMYHYHEWPDHGVPTGDSRLSYQEYLSKFRKHHLKTGQSLCTHCHAGVGRTSSDILIRQMMDETDRNLINENNCELRLNHLLYSLRLSGGSQMVQTEEQWAFVREMVQSYLQNHLSRKSRSVKQPLPQAEYMNLPFSPRPLGHNPVPEYMSSAELLSSKVSSPDDANGGVDTSPKTARKPPVRPKPMKKTERVRHPSTSSTESVGSTFGKAVLNPEVNSAYGSRESLTAFQPENYRITVSEDRRTEADQLWTTLYEVFTGYGKESAERQDEKLEELWPDLYKTSTATLKHLVMAKDTSLTSTEFYGGFGQKIIKDVQHAFSCKVVDDLVKDYGIDQIQKQDLGRIRYFSKNPGLLASAEGRLTERKGS